MTEQNTDLIKNSSPQHHLADLNIISLKKFIFLSLISLGLYNLWWTFKAWRFFAIKDNLKIMPAARAIFSIFFLYSLFKKINNYAQENGYTQNFSATWMFIGYLLCTLASRLPDFYWFISLFSFLFFIPAFVALNYAKQHSDQINAIVQNKFNTAQIVVIVIGSIFWILALIGLLFGD